MEQANRRGVACFAERNRLKKTYADLLGIGHKLSIFRPIACVSQPCLVHAGNYNSVNQGSVFSVTDLEGM